MRIEALTQCDVTLPGKGPDRKRALFPGQIYTLPDDVSDVVARLAKDGKVRLLREGTKAGAA